MPVCLKYLRDSIFDIHSELFKNLPDRVINQVMQTWDGKEVFTHQINGCKKHFSKPMGAISPIDPHLRQGTHKKAINITVLNCDLVNISLFQKYLLLNFDSLWGLKEDPILQLRLRSTLMVCAKFSSIFFSELANCRISYKKSTNSNVRLDTTSKNHL